MGWKTFNDRLALVLLVAILVLLGATAATEFHLPDIVLGAFISWGTLVLQYYFRKQPPEVK